MPGERVYRFQPLSATNTNSLFYRTNDEKTVGKLSVTHNGVFWSAIGGLFYGGFGTFFCYFTIYGQLHQVGNFDL